MAAFDINIVIPDAKLNDFIDALKANYGTKNDGSDYTSAELKDLVKHDLVSRLRKIYRDHMTVAPEDLGDS